MKALSAKTEMSLCSFQSFSTTLILMIFFGQTTFVEMHLPDMHQCLLDTLIQYFTLLRKKSCFWKMLTSDHKVNS